ncbi:hypothetical protein H0H92_004209 [Tricholoma furcatifolium]|nr:hypothetical protein H0H92_004209 [Tricholoma furcatifolium]
MAALSTNLSLTVSQVVSFLTTPLNRRVISDNALNKLKFVLDANLRALYAPTWRVENPLHKSGDRRLTLSPLSLPPRPIYDACISAGFQWYEWIAALGNVGFDLYADPGCVSICYHKDDPERNIIGGKYTTVWVDTSSHDFKVFAPHVLSKTFAQEVLENDHEDADHLFRMIAHETCIPPSPFHVHFAASTRPRSPMSAISEHSRSSSRSSNSSSTFSSDTSATSLSSSPSSLSAQSAFELQKPKQSRREKARQNRVFVDRSKNIVTPYDGGKTTVLTGGVMLGGARYVAPKPSNAVKPASGAASWRSA